MNEAASAVDGGLSDDRVEAVNKRETRSLYKKRVKIFPKRISGKFRRVKWAFLIALLGIYYVVPWIRWDRGPNAPDQAVLIDFPARRFYFFFIEIWPQEVYYLTGILILAAMGLFFATSLFGRVWCGWGCPQTVWTDLFMWVERQIEGDRSSRIRLDKAPWTPSKVGKRVFKHIVWLMIGAGTGGAWVFYFADAPTLARDLVTLQAPAAAWITIAFLTISTYLMAGHAREQVCTYMCPYARFQAAMLDENSLIVSYRDYRGEPRGPHKKGDSWEGHGHCIDCNQCVAVCPTGIDIRDGQQLECINCGLCIDACNDVMDRVGLERGLIALDTFANIEAHKQGRGAKVRFIRPRTIIYTVVMIAVASVMFLTLLTRATLDINVLRDRNPLFVTLSDGSIRNGYTFKILNKIHEHRSYDLKVRGIQGAEVSAVGQHGDNPVFTANPDKLASYRVFVRVPRNALSSTSADITFVLTDKESGEVATYDSVFRGPEQ
jgi:cytochrome c oxidase accessory protein FixG